MDFEQRLNRAIERGQRQAHRLAEDAARRALNDEELKRLHTRYRLELSEHIEKCLRALPGHFPGFRFETVSGERGWGAAVSRDDFAASSGRGRSNAFSHLEIAIRAHTRHHVLELVARGTVRNKEIFNRTHFQDVAEADPASFAHMIDLWVLEFAEAYAAQLGRA